uniref:Uncharacterized protein n=1 Tax=Cucumis melo TaxID=3656 RepID=A0A9I9EJ38_CUCME
MSHARCDLFDVKRVFDVRPPFDFYPGSSSAHVRLLPRYDFCPDSTSTNGPTFAHSSTSAHGSTHTYSSAELLEVGEVPKNSDEQLNFHNSEHSGVDLDIVRIQSFNKDAILPHNHLSLLLVYLFLVHHILLFSSYLEWRYTYPLLEEASLETWAIDVLCWCSSDLVVFLCYVFGAIFSPFQFCSILLWKSYIKRPMATVGPSLGAAVAIDFVVNYPEAICIYQLEFMTTNLKLYPLNYGFAFNQFISKIFEACDITLFLIITLSNNMSGSLRWDDRLMDSLKNFDFSSPKVKQQFGQKLGSSKELRSLRVFLKLESSKKAWIFKRASNFEGNFLISFVYGIGEDNESWFHGQGTFYIYVNRQFARSKADVEGRCFFDVEMLSLLKAEVRVIIIVVDFYYAGSMTCSDFYYFFWMILKETSWEEFCQSYRPSRLEEVLIFSFDGLRLPHLLVPSSLLFMGDVSF